MGISLDEWIENSGARQLEGDIQIHIEEALSGHGFLGTKDDAAELLRHIMISVRQYCEEKGKYIQNPNMEINKDGWNMSSEKTARTVSVELTEEESVVIAALLCVAIGECDRKLQHDSAEANMLRVIRDKIMAVQMVKP